MSRYNCWACSTLTVSYPCRTYRVSELYCDATRIVRGHRQYVSFSLYRQVLIQYFERECSIPFVAAYILVEVREYIQVVVIMASRPELKVCSMDLPISYIESSF